MKKLPPRWADRFLEWYCVPEKLEEIQGDAHELFQRRTLKGVRTARFLFVWDVCRFFRLKNIRGTKKNTYPTPLFDMVQNIILVAFRNFMRQPGHSFLNVFGLAAGFTCSMLILLWVAQEYSFDRFTPGNQKVFRVLTHVTSDDGVQTYDVASSIIDLSSVPEVNAKAVVSTGSRWPHELCFRPEENPDGCVYLKGVYSGESFFKVLAFPIAEGPSAPNVATGQIAISEKMALAIFGKTNAVGKVIKVDGRHDVSVVTVFKNIPVTSSLQFDFVMPFDILKKEWGIQDDQLATNFFEVYFTTRPGVAPDVLTPKLNTLTVRPKNLVDQKVSYEAFPLADWHLNSKFQNGKNTGGRIEYVRLFIVIALMVVMMAVINFINMTTSRASTRAKEIGIRKVTGAFRSGIIAQFLGESFITVLFAFILALGLAHFSLPAFNTLLPEPVTLAIFDGKILVYLLAFLLVVALVAGLYPAFVLSSFQPVKILKDRISGSLTGSNRLRKSLLVLQLSISLGIIIFSGVLYWQLNYIRSKDLGFDRLNMIHLEPTYRLLQKFEVFKESLRNGNEVVAVTATNVNPLNAGGGNNGISWPGKAPETRIPFSSIGVTHEFVETFGLHILEGRDFLPEIQDTAFVEALVTEEAVKTMKLAHPVGEHVSIGSVNCVIIGVVNNFHTGSLREARLPAIVHRVPLLNTGTVYIKYREGKAREALQEIQAAYHTLEPAYTMKFDFQDDTFSALYKTEATASKLVIVFTVVTLIIAFIGIIGLATFNVFRKTKEIGVRRVFGASPVQILSLLIKEFGWAMFGSLVLAVPVTYYFANEWLGTFVYHIGMPWWWYACSFIGIAALTLSIICVQAMNTVRGNPTDALRIE